MVEVGVCIKGAMGNHTFLSEVYWFQSGLEVTIGLQGQQRDKLKWFTID